MSDPNFVNAKNALVRYYTSKETIQGARLIGFTVALFTLLQTFQNSRNEPLSSIFFELTSQLDAFFLEYGLSELFGPYAWLWEPFKLLVLFVSILLLITMLIRTILRLAVYASYAQHTLLITQNEIEKIMPIHGAIDLAVYNSIKKRARKLYRLFPIMWFIYAEGEEARGQLRKGWYRSLIIAFISSVILTLLIW